MLIGRGQWGAACVGALLFFASESAHAQSASPLETSPISPGYAERLFHFEVMTGFATAVGLLGVRGELNLGDPLSLGMGIGTNGFGPEWEAHARWRIVHGVYRRKMYSALTLEGAFSRGRYERIDFPDTAECDELNPNDGCYNPQVVPQTVNWGQLELGWEAMFASGFTLRLSSGFARQIGTYQWQCQGLGQIVPCAPNSAPSDTLFVFSFAIGQAF